ncbi:hypothetical protein [Paracoccus beibuensis]|uniref:hypothetical protein n=1 Tax=Paracoccus beibuensis TaxID=547602 RepID=UPI00223F123E|nr:hypothetical protein [Paracoccus beibuensis]
MAKDRDLPERTSALEWAVALLGAAIIAGTVGFMIRHGLTHPATAPDVVVSPGMPRQVSGGYLVEFTAFNRGNTTAASLTIKGSLTDGNRIIETSEVTLDYLPQRASRTGGLFFQNDPAQHDLSAEAGGYVAP